MTLDNFPTTRPAFTANFARSQQLPPQVTFSRASTGTYVDKNGLVQTAANNTPRFDWKDGKCQGLLIEQTRTNYLQHNSDFSNAAWYKRGTPATAAPVTTAPDGTLTAQGAAISPAANTYVLSVYTPQTNIAGGLVSTDLTNEWQYYSQQFTYVNSTDRFTVYPVQLGPNNYIGQELLGIVPTGKVTVSGWAKTDGSNIWVWGVQAEAGGFATSLIPTAGATATRANDIFAINGDDFNSWYNNPERTMVVNMSCEIAAGYGMMWGFYGGGRRIEGYPGKSVPFEGLCFFYGGGVQKYIGRGGDQQAVWNQDGLLQKCAYTWNFQTGEGAVKLQDAKFAPASPPDTGIPLTEPLSGFRLMGGQNSTNVTNTGIVASVHYYPHEVSLEALEALTQ